MNLLRLINAICYFKNYKILLIGINKMLIIAIF